MKCMWLLLLKMMWVEFIHPSKIKNNSDYQWRMTMWGGREYLLGAFVLFSNTDRNLMNMLIPKKQTKAKMRNRMASELHEKIAFKSGLKNQCGSPLPTLDKNLVDFGREIRTKYNQPDPRLCRLLTKWSHYSLWIIPRLSDLFQKSGTFSANAQSPANLQAFINCFLLITIFS